MAETTIGKRIVILRKQHGLTQEQLAERVGVSAQAVSKWENDQSCPDISTLPLLADALEVSVDHLLGREAAALAGTVVDKRGSRPGQQRESAEKEHI